MRPKITGRAGKASSRRSTTCGSPPGAIRVSFWSAQVHFELVPNEFGEPAGSWTRTPLPTRAVFGCSCGRGGSRAGCDGSGNSFWKFWNELAHPPVLRPARKQAVHTLIDLEYEVAGSARAHDSFRCRTVWRGRAKTTSCLIRVFALEYEVAGSARAHDSFRCRRVWRGRAKTTSCLIRVFALGWRIG